MLLQARQELHFLEFINKYTKLEAMSMLIQVISDLKAQYQMVHKTVDILKSPVITQAHQGYKRQVVNDPTLD